jgi:hypothetical protein
MSGVSSISPPSVVPIPSGDGGGGGGGTGGGPMGGKGGNIPGIPSESSLSEPDAGSMVGTIIMGGGVGWSSSESLPLSQSAAKNMSEHLF